MLTGPSKVALTIPRDPAGTFDPKLIAISTSLFRISMRRSSRCMPATKAVELLQMPLDLANRHACVTRPDLGGHRCWRRPANGRTGHSTKGCAPGNPTDRDIKDAASTGRNLHPKPIHLPQARLDRVKHDPPFRLNPRRSNTRAFAQSGFNEVRTVKAAYPEDGPHRTLQILLIRLRLGMVFRNRTHGVVTNLLAPVVG